MDTLYRFPGEGGRWFKSVSYALHDPNLGCRGKPRESLWPTRAPCLLIAKTSWILEYLSTKSYGQQNCDICPKSYDCALTLSGPLEHQLRFIADEEKVKQLDNVQNLVPSLSIPLGRKDISEKCLMKLITCLFCVLQVQGPWAMEMLPTYYYITSLDEADHNKEKCTKLQDRTLWNMKDCRDNSQRLDLIHEHEWIIETFRFLVVERLRFCLDIAYRFLSPCMECFNRDG